MIHEVLQELFTNRKFFLIAGPCAVESHAVCREVAGRLKAICDGLGMVYVFKASYRKANRSHAASFTGIGDLQALEILREIRREFGVPVVTDIHESPEAEMASQYVDMLQIPAFLSRQTALIAAAAETGLPVNIKKGQFMDATAMGFAAEKVTATGNAHVILTERGNSFGYQDLVVDMRNIPTLRRTGHPVALDVTHALQTPNAASGVTGGQPEYAATLLLAGVAAGADGIFLETHPEPARAKSDSATMLTLDAVEGMLRKARLVRDVLWK